MTGVPLINRSLVALSFSVLLALAVTGCSGPSQDQGGAGTGSSAEQTTQAQSDSQSTADEADSSQSDNSLLSGGGEWPTTRVGQVFPEPQFASKPYRSNVIGDDSATVYYDNVTADEVTAYVQTLEDAGYTDNVSESKGDGLYSWSADDGNGDGLYNGFVSISYTAENGEHKNDVMLQISVLS